PGRNRATRAVRAAKVERPVSVQLSDVRGDTRGRAKRAVSGHRVAVIEPPSSTRIRRIPPVFRTARPRYTYLTEARRFGPSTRNALWDEARDATECNRENQTARNRDLAWRFLGLPTSPIAHRTRTCRSRNSASVNSCFDIAGQPHDLMTNSSERLDTRS